MVGRRRQDGELKVKQQQGLSMNAGPRRERNRTFRRNQLQQQQQNNTSYKLQSSPVHIYSRKDDNFSDIAQEDSTHTQSSDSRRAALTTQVLSSSASSTTATPRTAASQMFASSFDTSVIFNLHVTFLIRETGILDSVYHVQKILKLHGSSVELKFLSTAASQSTANAEQHLQSSTYQSLPPHSPTEKSTYVVEIRFPGKNYNDIADRQSCERCVAAAFKKAKIPWSCVRHYTTRPGSIIWTLLLFFMEADQDEVLTRLDALKQFSTYRMVGELQSEYTPQVTIVPAEDYSSMSSFVPSSSSSALSLDPPDSSEEIIAEFEWRVSTSKVQYQRLCRLFEAKGIVNTLLQNRGVGIRGDREKDDVSGETRFPMNKNCLASSLLLQRPPFHTITFKVVYLGSFCSDDLLPECLEGALQFPCDLNDNSLPYSVGDIIFNYAGLLFHNGDSDASAAYVSSAEFNSHDNQNGLIQNFEKVANDSTSSEEKWDDEDIPNFHITNGNDTYDDEVDRCNKFEVKMSRVTPACHEHRNPPPRQPTYYRNSSACIEHSLFRRSSITLNIAENIDDKITKDSWQSSKTEKSFSFFGCVCDSNYSDDDNNRIPSRSKAAQMSDMAMTATVGHRRNRCLSVNSISSNAEYIQQTQSKTRTMGSWAKIMKMIWGKKNTATNKPFSTDRSMTKQSGYLRRDLTRGAGVSTTGSNTVVGSRWQQYRCGSSTEDDIKQRSFTGKAKNPKNLHHERIPKGQSTETMVKNTQNRGQRPNSFDEGQKKDKDSDDIDYCRKAYQQLHANGIVKNYSMFCDKRPHLVPIRAVSHAVASETIKPEVEISSTKPSITITASGLTATGGSGWGDGKVSVIDGSTAGIVGGDSNNYIKQVVPHESHGGR